MCVLAYILNNSDSNQLLTKYMYCEIIIVGVGRMFVASEGNPCTRNYIPTNVDTSICLVFIYLYKIEIATDEITSPRTMKIWLPTNIYPHNLKWFHSMHIHQEKNILTVYMFYVWCADIGNLLLSYHTILTKKNPKTNKHSSKLKKLKI